MKLCVVAVGNKMPAWINSGFQEYARRMPREASLSLVEVKPEKREKANLTLKEKERLLTREAERIALNIPARSLIVVLDERGKTASTVHFAKQLTEWMKNGKDVTFILGSADGVANEIKKSADSLLALSEMTLPHGLARVVLAEQLYRALSYVNGHPYHRE